MVAIHAHSAQFGGGFRCESTKAVATPSLCGMSRPDEETSVSREQRLNAIRELLWQRGRLDVEATARTLQVSAATVRRDFDSLAVRQMLTRTHGGAIPNSTASELPLRYKAVRHAPEKRRIAEAAAALVSRGMVVGLTGGTTTTEVARSLATRADLASD